MLPCMSQLAHIYSHLSDSEHVVALTLNSTVDAAELILLNRAGEISSLLFDENKMNEFRSACHPALTWVSFFELMQKTFSEHLIVFTPPSLKLTIKHERRSDVIPVPIFITSFTVVMPPLVTNKPFLEDFVSRMVTYLAIRNGDASREIERLEGIGKYEKELNEFVIHIRQEIAVLSQESNKIAAMKEISKKINEDLKKIKSPERKHINEMIELAISDKAALDKVISRVSDPLGSQARQLVTQSFHVDLLQWIKDDCLRLSQMDDSSSSSLSRPFDFNPLPSKMKKDLLQKNLTGDVIAMEFIKMYHEIFNWDFDIFRFDMCCKDISPASFPRGALFYLGYFAFCRLGLLIKFNLSETCLIHWLSMVEAGYKDVPFHNYLHAADVLQAILCFLFTDEIIKLSNLSLKDQLSLIVSAIIIDFGHPGTNNEFHIRTRDNLSCIYADESPLEQMHLASVLELMKLPRYNLFRIIDPTLKKGIEDQLSFLLLSTDLKRHDMILAAFRLRQIEVFSKKQQNFLCAADDFCSNNHSILIICLMLKSADVSYCVRKEEIYMKWVKKLQEEYKNLGELEFKNNLTVSSFMGPSIMNNITIARQQIAFINIVVLPMFTMLSDFIPIFRKFGEKISKNKSFWANAEEIENGHTKN